MPNHRLMKWNEIMYMLCDDVMIHKLHLENPHIHKMCCAGKNDIILKTYDDCYYLHRKDMLCYKIDILPQIIVLQSYFDLNLFLTCDEHNLKRLHLNNTHIYLGQCSHVFLDIRNNIIYTSSDFGYLLYIIDIELLLSTKKLNCNSIYNIQHLTFNNSVLGVYNYKDDVKKELCVYTLYIHDECISVHKHFMVNNDISNTNINLELNHEYHEHSWLFNKDHIAIEHYDEKTLIFNLKTGLIVTIFDNLKVIYSDYLHTHNSMLYMCEDNFYVIPISTTNHMLKHNINFDLAKLFLEVQNDKFTNSIIGQFDTVTPHISDDEHYIFYINNYYICVIDLCPYKNLHVTKFQLDRDVEYTSLHYDVLHTRLLIGTCQGSIIEYNLCHSPLSVYS